jgi:competence protein ComGC
MVHCRICADSLVGRVVHCPRCESPFHADCWAYNGRCAVYGCGAMTPAAAPVEPAVDTPFVIDGDVPPPPSSTSVIWGILLALAGVAAIVVPNVKMARLRAEARACYANQKTIIGAVEMYNLDRNTRWPDGAVDLTLLGSLRGGGYIRSTPSDPGQGPGTKGNYILVRDSAIGIRCRVHGTIE